MKKVFVIFKGGLPLKGTNDKVLSFDTEAKAREFITDFFGGSKEYEVLEKYSYELN